MHRLPTMHTHGLWAQAGALISYGTHFGDLSRRAATYVNKILKGENPATLPVQQPTSGLIPTFGTLGFGLR